MSGIAMVKSSVSSGQERDKSLAMKNVGNKEIITYPFQVLF
jgi:hypothetical protein